MLKVLVSKVTMHYRRQSLNSDAWKWSQLVAALSPLLFFQPPLDQQTKKPGYQSQPVHKACLALRVFCLLH